MAEVYSHQCSCGQIYEDNDPDLYFCSVCIKKRKQIAAEIDKKLAGTVSKRQHKSNIQIYDEIMKRNGRVKLNDI